MCQKIRFATTDDGLNIYNLEKLSIKGASSYDMILKEIDENTLANYLIIESILEQSEDTTSQSTGIIAGETTAKKTIETMNKKNTSFTGYLGYWQLADEYHITNIAIYPTYQGRGYAKALIIELINIAKKNNIIAISLEVRRSNINAIKLYENTGFIHLGVRPKYYTDGEDALIMTFNLI
ncbi:MAG: ribosomal protein S18-alanine N-acetyltransferase [Eubacteriales bacterium]|nr:ribosomal protein S18-alanine N-acetyltransferase [Eubacteriales bacterium]MDY3332351.1 ribosomal protein S18-alanine N-acetyltransferase [Gallibacter sp.]